MKISDKNLNKNLDDIKFLVHSFKKFQTFKKLKKMYIYLCRQLFCFNIHVQVLKKLNVLKTEAVQTKIVYFKAIRISIAFFPDEFDPYRNKAFV